MIQLCSRAVLTKNSDGTTAFFQPDKLQEKLASSCRAAGMNDAWIAEDIALSVEFTLGELGKGKVFTNAEIDSIVVKVLHEAGLGAIAIHYRQLQDNSEEELSFKRDKITEIVNRYLQVDKEYSESIISQVEDAGRKLLLKQASPTLILELAKHYMNETPLLATQAPSSLESCPWLITKEAILKKISGDTSKLIAAEALSPSGISRLFPSIRVEVKFAKFAEEFNLTPPTADFLLISYLQNLADALDDIIETTQHLTTNLPTKQDNIPVYLKFVDAPGFTEQWLGGNWNESTSCFEELVTELKELMKNDIFSIN